MKNTLVGLKVDVGSREINPPEVYGLRVVRGNSSRENCATFCQKREEWEPVRRKKQMSIVTSLANVVMTIPYISNFLLITNVAVTYAVHTQS